MKKSVKRISSCCILAIISFVFMTACATTQFDAVWKDDTYQGGPLKKVLVIGVTKKPQIRIYFEEELAGQLRAAETDAVPSYTVMPQDVLPEKDAIIGLIDKLKIDSLLITRFVDIKDVGTYETMPTTVNRGYYGYYMESARTESLGYNIVLETRIFEAKNEKLIWSGLSETILEGDVENSIDSLIPAIVNNLLENKLLKAR